MTPKPPDPIIERETEPSPTHKLADPVAQPSPPMDGKKAIPAGDLEVEKFNVINDTGGGD